MFTYYLLRIQYRPTLVTPFRPITTKHKIGYLADNRHGGHCWLTPKEGIVVQNHRTYAVQSLTGQRGTTYIVQIFQKTGKLALPKDLSDSLLCTFSP